MFGVTTVGSAISLTTELVRENDLMPCGRSGRSRLEYMYNALGETWPGERLRRYQGQRKHSI
jgi:hypothetical protein